MSVHVEPIDGGGIAIAEIEALAEAAKSAMTKAWPHSTAPSYPVTLEELRARIVDMEAGVEVHIVSGASIGLSPDKASSMGMLCLDFRPEKTYCNASTFESMARLLGLSAMTLRLILSKSSNGEASKVLTGLFHQRCGAEAFAVYRAKTDGTIRGISRILPGGGTAIKHSTTLEWLGQLLPVGADQLPLVKSWFLQDNGAMNLKLENPETKNVALGLTEVGDVVSSGLVVTNNDMSTKNSNVPRISLYVEYLRCTNGLVVSDAKDATTGLERSKRTLSHAVENIREGFATDYKVCPPLWHRALESIRYARTVMVDSPAKVAVALMREFRVDKALTGHILSYFDGERETTPMSRWEFINQWTTAAREHPLVAVRASMERMAGEMLSIPLEVLNLDETAQPQKKGKYKVLQFNQN